MSTYVAAATGGEWLYNQVTGGGDDQGGGFLGSTWGNITGANRQAEAAQAAAMAQLTAARETRAEVLKQGERNIANARHFAQATPEELAALTQMQSASEQQLRRQQELLSAIDPSIMEASKQALSILRGGTADMNKPLMAQRAAQRDQLVNSLRAQYGPGAENSSLGQRALRQFDMESDTAFQSNQQSSLNQLMGIASSDPHGAGYNSAIGNLGNVFSARNALSNRILNTELSTGNAMLGALSGTSQQVIDAAGAPWVGQQVQAQAQMGLANMGMQGAMAYATNGASAGANTSPNQPGRR